MKALEISNLKFAYGGETIFSNVSFSIEALDFLALIGPNGGGKTTLLKLMMGLLRPSEGSVKIFGEKPPARGLVGYVPQNTNANLAFPITAAECVSTAIPEKKKNVAQVEELLKSVGMEAHRSKKLGELSGGERQRVLVARALALKPKVLFLDEPSSNMDSSAQEKLFEMLGALNRELTIVLVSHDLTAVSRYVKSVACVNRSVHYHAGANFSNEMMKEAFGCDMELIAHGVPHRVFGSHDHTNGGCCSS